MWRNHLSEPFSVYSLNTVTFGIKPVPYLATKCIQQIAEYVRQEFPIAAKLIRSDFFVDDVISGCDNLEEAIMTRKQLCEIFSRYGFHLRKWCRNNSPILDNVPECDQGRHFDIQTVENIIKTIGMIRDHKSDKFLLNASKLDEIKISKTICTVGSIFHPLGLYMPVTVSQS